MVSTGISPGYLPVGREAKRGTNATMPCVHDRYRLSFRALALIALVVASGCKHDERDPLVVRVAAAASLQSVGTELAAEFSRETGRFLTFSFGGSSQLAENVLEGAPADVLLTADASSMARVTKRLAYVKPVGFATNRAVVVVAPRAAERVAGVRDLARPDLVVVLCAAQAACGAVADRVLAQAGVTVAAASREPNVNALLTRLRLGEADAGIAYGSDGRAAGDTLVVRTVTPPVTTTYFAAVVAERADPAAARSRRVPRRAHRAPRPGPCRVRRPVTRQRSRSFSGAVFVAVAGAGLLLLALPLVALVVRAPWSSVGDILGDHAATTALRLSLVCSLAATVVAVALGVPLGWLLARRRVPLARLVRSVALVPLVLPPVAGGVGLLMAFGRNGLAGRWLDTWFGIHLPFTTAGAILAEAFVALPFVVITAETAVRGVDPATEQAARSLGATRWEVARRVVLPQARVGLIAGAVLAWARALGEFGATITFAGSTPGRTTTLPLHVFFALEAGDTGPAVMLSLVLVAISMLVLVSLRQRWLVVR